MPNLKINNTKLRYVAWNFSWFIKYHVKEEDYDDDAKSYLIRKNLSLSEEQFAVSFPHGKYNLNHLQVLFG